MIEGVEVVVRKPGKPDRVVRLQEGVARMGRAEDNEIVLSDVGVSRRHAQIRVSPSDVEIEDLGSGNGTYYHGYRIKMQVLQDGDEIVIDPFVLQVRIKGDVVPAEGSAPSQATPARLEVVTGHGMAGSSYPITAAGLTIGRSEDRDVVIPDPASSRHHVTIYVEGAQYTMKDMGSANGVFVNAVRVRECLLADGDLIRIGNTELRFRIYDKKAGDTTTQVMPGQEVWSQTDSVAPKKGGGIGRWIAIAAGLLLLVGGIGLVLIVGVVLLLLHLNGAFVQVEIPPRAPAYALHLPGGLPSSSIDKLYDDGMASLKGGDAKYALQNFYRVQHAQPDHVGARKLSVAAAETLVFTRLQQAEATRVQARQARDAVRDGLLVDFQGGGAAKRQARERLAAEFSSDVRVQAALKLPPTDPQKAHAELLAQAAAATPGTALGLYEQVLAESDSVEHRQTAVAKWREARAALAKETLEVWTVAALHVATNGPDAVPALDALAAADPLDPTVSAYRNRLQ